MVPLAGRAAPILHYLASNPLHFAVTEAIVPLAVVLAAVTIVVVGLRVGLKDWHRSALACTALLVVVFGYGHVAGLVDGWLHRLLMFSIAVILVAILVVLTCRLGASVRRLSLFLNVMAAVLLAFPTASLAVEAVGTQNRSDPTRGPETLDDLAAPSCRQAFR